MVRENDVELSQGVHAAAKTEIRRRRWASLRGKATRTYIREHPEVVEEFANSSTIAATSFPSYVTRASVLLELRMRAARKEITDEVRQWRKEHPVEARALAEQLKKEMAEEAGKSDE